MALFAVPNLIQDLIPAASESINPWNWNLNASGLFLPTMHALSKFALLGACAVHSVMGLPESVERREANLLKRNVDDWINRETPIAWQRLLCNIGPNGCAVANQGVPAGVVVASPSRANPDYWYTWTRDAALVFKGIADAFARNYTADLHTQLKNFVGSQAKLQGVGNPSGGLSDGQGLGEAKFMVDLKEYTGEWGRPQRDGPPLRAIALIRYAKWLVENGYKSTAESQVWPTIENDLKYSAQYWNQTGFDLWEEVPGSSFFTIASTHRALIEGAQLGAALGKPTRVYTTVAPQVLCFQQSFWNAREGFIVSNINGGEYRRGRDANSLLVAIHNFDPSAGCDANTFQPCSDKALSNHKAVVDSFRSIYNINRGIAQNKAVAVGRYSEDVYYNGNPWFLTTFAAAEQLYDALLVWKAQGSITITQTSLSFFRDHVSGATVGTHAAGSTIYNQIISAITAYADGFVEINSRYAHSNGAMPEQYDRNSGSPLAAPDLTWSYSSFLTATARRDGYIPSGWGAGQATALPSGQCQKFEIASSYSLPPTPSFPSSISPAPNAPVEQVTSVPAGCTNPEKVFVTFNQRATTAWGQVIKIVGNVPELGGWDVNKAIPLSASGYTGSNPLWSITVPIQAGSNVQYKYIRITNGVAGVSWESGDNRAYTVPGATCNIQSRSDNWK
ncbi:family 15 putative glycoside hydrolase [Triangularia setosa]|uniref:Glucoamylase n=1 Tax=Triangularia setosa TaxID=2587417 RepID=A0AAN6W655_9PEZI|nr:family 15 putative glycoside hydrolase [Podospora setosa]